MEANVEANAEAVSLLQELINSVYPTPEEIMEEPAPEYPDGVVDLLTTWKSNFFTRMWRNTPLERRLEALRFLVEGIAVLYNFPVAVEFSDRYCYMPKTKKIYFDGRKASIISALHELGHHLEGASELKACRWSVHLFKMVFPKQFNKLTWEGHALVRKPA